MKLIHLPTPSDGLTTANIFCVPSKNVDYSCGKALLLLPKLGIDALSGVQYGTKGANALAGVQYGTKGGN